MLPITLNILCNHLNLDCCCAGFLRSKRFTNCSLVPQGNVQSAAQDILYFGPSASIEAFLTRHPQAFGVCLESRPQKKGTKRDQPEASSSFNSNIAWLYADNPAATYECIQTENNRYIAWEKNVLWALAQGGAYQDVLNVSEDIFSDCICVVDSSYRLLAHTEHNQSKDWRTQFLVNHGYHTVGTIEELKKVNFRQRWQVQTGVIRMGPTNACDDATLSYLFRTQGNTYLNVVLHCDENEYMNEALLDSFKMLIDYLAIYEKREEVNSHRLTRPYTSLVASLIKGEIATRDKALARLEDLQIATKGSFITTIIRPFVDESDYDNVHDYVGYFARRINDFFPQTKRLIIDDAVVQIHEFDELPPAQNTLKELDDSYRDIVNRFAIAVGCSCSFGWLGDLNHAYLQALVALEQGLSARGTLAQQFNRAERNSHFYKFSDYFLPYLYEKGCENREFVDFCLRQTPVYAIYTDDKLNGTNNAEMLYAYLQLDRNIRLVSEQLNVHRNTVAYRIERLTQTYNLDLDNAYVRECLRMYYHQLLL